MPVSASKGPALLERVLEARDGRARLRGRTFGQLEGSGLALGELSLNVPGWPKLGRVWLLVFARGLEAAEAQLGLELRALWADEAGYWALVSSPQPLELCKRVSCAIEDAAPWGRLLDFDWYAHAGGGAKLARAGLGLGERRCMVCGGEQGPCISELRHEIASVRASALDLARSARRQGRAHA